MIRTFIERYLNNLIPRNIPSKIKKINYKKMKIGITISLCFAYMEVESNRKLC